jgi:hypothetical protein
MCARYGVCEYWVVDLIHEHVVTPHQPAQGGYQVTHRYGAGDESKFMNLCDLANLTCNKSHRDETGWDFIVEFPMTAPPGSDTRSTSACCLPRAIEDHGERADAVAVLETRLDVVDQVDVESARFLPRRLARKRGSVLGRYNRVG